MVHKLQVTGKKGQYVVRIVSPSVTRAGGGDDCCEASIESQTATVGMHYIQRIQRFHMVMKYKCEGRYNIPHTWEVS